MSRFVPTQGTGGILSATQDSVCESDAYWPSELEQGFRDHVLDWTKDRVTLCDHLVERNAWIQANLQGQVTTPGIFSSRCRKGKQQERMEPLAGILRDPRMFCDGTGHDLLFSIDWLILADSGSVRPSAKKILFDAGGTRFMDAMSFFTSQYEKRGIIFDEIYVWEAIPQGIEGYWAGTPAEIRQKWESRLTFYDGVPCTATMDDTQNNPMVRIGSTCQPDDFCAFKLDIDTPSVELPLVQQLLTSPKIAGVLDEFFFEHHVHGLMQSPGWGENVNGTFADSYEIFSQLRRMGVRAHSWI